MAKTRARTGSKKKDITLHDVIAHMNNMHQDLSKRIGDLEVGLGARIDQNSADIRKLNIKIDDLEMRLTQRIDALYEDLTATIMDTIKIKKHVGMAVSDEFDA